MIMTLEEMRTKYPNKWLGICDEQYDKEGHLLSANVVYTDKTSDELALMSINNEGVIPYFTTPDSTFLAGGLMSGVNVSKGVDMSKGSLLYKSPEEKVEDILEYINDLREERDRALKQVEEWNKDAEIKSLEERLKNLYSDISDGFIPDKEQWEKIHKWEEEHWQKYHPTLKTLPRRKYIESPEFRYEFGRTVLGKVCSITCISCKKKAIQKSKGSLARFDKICKQLEVSCIIGEV